MIKDKLILVGVILFNLMVFLNSRNTLLYFVLNIMLVYIYNDHDTTMFLIMITIVVYILAEKYLVENFDCVGNNMLISTSARTLDCQEICKDRKDCKYTFQPYNENNKPRDCYVSKGLGLTQKLNLGKCNEEKMAPWKNKNFKEKQEVLLLDTSDVLPLVKPSAPRWCGWYRRWYWWAWWYRRRCNPKAKRSIRFTSWRGFNPVGGMNKKRFQFKKAYVTRIKITNVEVKDQGWGNYTGLRINGINNTTKKTYGYFSAHPRNTKKMNLSKPFDIKKMYENNQIIDEIYLRPGRLGSGHTMTYGGVQNIKVWGYEV
jgi:hypothetical protein